MDDRLSFSIVEAAKFVGVSRTTMYTEIGEGRLKACKLGRRVLIRRVDLDEWLANLTRRSVK